MLTCREFAHRRASDYLDGQLGWRARLGVWFHLIRCDYCRRFIAQFQKIRGLLRKKNLQDSVSDPVTELAARELGARLADLYIENQKKSEQEKKSSPRL